MLKIYNYSQVHHLEELATGAMGQYTMIDLYEHMANCFCAQFQRDFKRNKRLVIFAGPGGNGAVSLAIGRILSGLDNQVEAVLLNSTGLISDECQINYRRLVETGVPAREVTTSFNPPVIGSDDIVIDGICGIDLTTPFAGDLARVAEYINRVKDDKHMCVLSVDIPSGLMTEDNDNNNLDSVIRATHTYTFHGPKLAFLLSDNQEYVGQWKVINVGLDDDMPNKDISRYIFTSADLDGKIPMREKFSNKYDYGRVALVAGSKGMMGAALLAGNACLRSGAGHLTMHVPAGMDKLVHSNVPEAVVSTDKSGSSFTMFSDADKYDAIAVGPGLRVTMEAALALEGLFKYSGKPMIIDADALNILATNQTMQKNIPEDSILTPHAGEFDRLFGESHSDYERLMKASEMAKKLRVNIVLKGAYTAICSKAGRIIFNSSGNAGMATAGSGDVLTGCMLAFLGRYRIPLIAALFAVYVHGYAGDLYAAEYSEESLIARDIIDYIPKVLKYYKAQDNPLYML